MNCELVQNRIDNLIFDVGAIPEKEIMSHIETCAKCSNYYQESLNATQLMQEIREAEPVLKRPDELTDSIMKAIGAEADEPLKQSVKIKLFTRLLAAAVIALLLTLGIEQYIVLNKLHSLESQLGMAEQPQTFDKNILHKANLLDIGSLVKTDDQHFGLGKVKVLFRLNRAQQFNFTFYDINRYMVIDEFKHTDSLNNQKQ